MAVDIFVHGGHVIDPGAAFDGRADLLILAGIVQGYGSDIHCPSNVRRLDATGCVVSPGFIDLHTHLRYPGFPEKETVASGTEAAAAGGFTTVCAMANTNPVVDDPAVLSDVLAEVRSSAVVRVHQLGAVTRGLRGQSLTDLPALAAAGAVAFSDDGKPVVDGEMMRAALASASRLGKPISVHEEDPAIVGSGVANAGPRAQRHGLAPWPCDGETQMVVRDLRLLAETGGHLHIAHVSCAETVRVLRAAREVGLTVTAEVTPHHLRLTDALLDGDETCGLAPAHPCTKVNPPLRTAADVQVLVKALADGVIDAVATDHAPHTTADKEQSYAGAAFGFSGIELALPLLLDLVRDRGLLLSAAIERLTAGPARVFHLPGGTLVPGSPGDVCVFDPDAAWMVEEAQLRSRGKNTPLLRNSVRGRVRHTIVGGKVVYSDGAMI